MRIAGFAGAMIGACLLPQSYSMAASLSGPTSPRSVSECERFRGEYSTHLSQLRKTYNDCRAANVNQPTSQWQPGYDTVNRGGPVIRVPSQCVSASDEWGSASRDFGSSINQCLTAARSNVTVRVTNLQDVLVSSLKNRTTDVGMKGAEALAQWCLDECKSAQGLHSLKAGLAAHDKALEITRIPNLLFNGDVTAMVDFFRTNHLASIEMTKQAALFTIDISQQYLHMLETSLNGMSGSYAPNVQQPSKVVIDYLAQIYGELGNTASDINAAWQKHQLGLLNDTIQSGLDQGGGILAPGHGGSTRSSGRSSTGSSRSNCTACTGPGCACR